MAEAKRKTQNIQPSTSRLSQLFMARALRNENNKIELYLTLGCCDNCRYVGEYDTLRELYIAAKKMLKNGEKCANDFTARGFLYHTKESVVTGGLYCLKKMKI